MRTPLHLTENDLLLLIRAVDDSIDVRHADPLLLAPLHRLRRSLVAGLERIADRRRINEATWRSAGGRRPW